MVSHDPQDDLTLSSYLSVLAASWRMIATITAVVLLLGLGYALLAEPVYRADALIQVEDGDPASDGALGQLSALFDGKSSVETETDLLSSRLVVGATVDQLRLDIDVVPRRFPVIGGWLSRRAADDGTAPVQFGPAKYAWGNEQADVADFDVPPAWREQRFVLAAGGGNTYALRSPDGDPVLHGVVGEAATGTVGGGPVRLLVTALRARPGTEFLLRRQSWQRTVGKLQDDLKIDMPSRQSEVIRMSLEGHDSARVSETVNTLAQQYVQQNISRRSAEAEQTLVFMTRQLPVIRTELEQAEKRYNDYLTRHGTLNLPDEANLLLQQMVDGKTRLFGLQQQREELRQRFNDAHPSVAALGAQIAAAQRALDQLTRQMTTLPAVEQGSMRLLRDVKVNTELYTSLLNNAQQLRVVKAGQIGNVRIVDHAITADEPVRPRKALVAALALALGLVAGIGAAFLRKALFGGVESSEEIEEALGIPVFAIIPRSTEQRRLERAPQHHAAGEGVLAATAPDDAAVEGLRSLRTALQFSMPDAPNKVVMVTGTAPGVGKSFTSINLSAVLATPTSRVLLIDADMRRGEIHASFAAQRVPGLADVLQGVPLEKALLRDALPNLDVLCAGYRTPNPAELLMSERFAALLAQVSPHYDVIVIDTPPVLAVTDASLIGKHAGTTLLVIRHGSQPVAAIREAVKRLRYAGVALRGALLTDVPHWNTGYGTYQTEPYDYGSARG